MIHRDLACRNLLCSKGDYKYFVTVKVADFGLSRKAQEGIYTSGSTEIPYKWCSPEVVRTGQFSSSSDVFSLLLLLTFDFAKVWAFGVTLWEIFSFGDLPYQGMSNKETVEAVQKATNTPTHRAVIVIQRIQLLLHKNQALK